MSRRAVVIGAGVVGLATAWHLAERGLRVRVIDAAPYPGDGCSWGNAGMVVPSHIVPLAAPGALGLARRWLRNPESPLGVDLWPSLELLTWGFRFWRAATAERVDRAAPVLGALLSAGSRIYSEWAERWSDDFGLTRRGLLMLCEGSHALREEAGVVPLARQLGILAEVLTATDVERFEPSFYAHLAGGVYFPGDAHLDPARLMGALRGELEHAGVTFHDATAATGFRLDGRRLEAVVTSRGELEADEVVLAAGCASTEIARRLNLSLPLAAGRGYSLSLPAPRQMPTYPAILSEARVAITPFAASLRFGGAMALSTPRRAERAPFDHRRVAGLVKSIERVLPGFHSADFEGLEPWSGLRPCTPDGLPYLGRAQRYDNLTIATGHAMMGVSLAGISGRLIAELISGQPPSIDLELLRPDRYDRRTTPE